MIASVIETCKLIGVEPYAHFPDVITRNADGLSQSRFDEHLPCAQPGTNRLGLRTALTSYLLHD